MSNFTHADYLAMKSRCDAGKKSVAAPAPIVRNKNQPEVGRGGIQEDIETWLKTQSHRAWWTTSRFDKATMGRCGIPDFIGVFSGVAFGLEVKKVGNKPSTDQLGELAWMRKAGAKTAVVYSKDEALEFFIGLLDKKI